MFSDDIPPDLIRADEALAGLLDLDPDVSAWKAAGSPMRVRPSKEEIAEWKKATGKRQLPKPRQPVTEGEERLYLTATKKIEDLTKSIVAAVLARKLRSFAWLDGKREPLPKTFWEDGRGSLSVAAGTIRWHGNLDGWVLCLDRAAWKAWRDPASAPPAALRADEARTRVFDWYQVRVTSYDPQRAAPSREDDIEAAKEHLKALGLKVIGLKDIVRDVRGELGGSWRVGGPRGRKREAAARLMADRPK
jgi:hypothetical protein